MKKILSTIFALVIMVSFSFYGFASEFQKTKVIVEKASVYETSSVKSDKMVTVKEGYSFTPVGSTKSFWKIEFKKKNDDTIYVGYVLKADTDATTLQESEKAKDTNTANVKKPGKNWVPYSTSSLKTLAKALADGNVVYYDGQYWASPEYAAMLANENVVYSNDVAPEEPTDRYSLAD